MNPPVQAFRGFVTDRVRVWIWRTVILLAVLRLITVVYSGIANTRGDFYATLPGAHVRDLNPDLWNSPDLARSWAFQRDDYLYGPHAVPHALSNRTVRQL